MRQSIFGVVKVLSVKLIYVQINFLLFSYKFMWQVRSRLFDQLKFYNNFHLL